MELSSIIKKLNSLENELQSARETLRREKSGRESSLRNYRNASQARSVLQSVAQKVQDEVHGQMASVVTKCVRAVFPEEDLEFLIRFDRKRGKTEASLIFVRGGVEIEDVLSSESGGLVDVASFGLRLARILIGRGRKIMFLDEPARNIHGRDNRIRFLELLKSLSEELEFQFIISTGLDWLRVGRVVDVEEIEKARGA